MTMADREMNYKSIFGAYVMRAQYELESWNRKQNTEENEINQVVQETIEDYIEQA